jgi:PAS domain S-box-containing protein
MIDFHPIQFKEHEMYLKEHEMNTALEDNAAIEMDSFSRTEWQEPPALTLDERGMICDCSNAGEKLFGYRRKEMVSQHVSNLLPELSEIQLIKNGQFNPQLGFLSHCGHHFRAINRLGGIFLNELHFVLLEYAGRRTIRMIVHPFHDIKS